MPTDNSSPNEPTAVTDADRGLDTTIRQLLDRVDTLLARLEREPPAIRGRWMTTSTCAAYIDRSVNGVRGLVRRGMIPFVKQGELVYFDKEKLDRWMTNSGRRHAQSMQRKEDARRHPTPPDASRMSPGGDPT